MDKRTLAWRAPGDRNPGKPVSFDPDSDLVLSSLDDRKTLSVSVVGSEDDFPVENVQWEIKLNRRNTPLDPPDSYLWRAIAKINQACLPQFKDREEAHSWFDKLAKWDLLAHHKKYFLEDEQEIKSLMTSAMLARADVSYNAGNYQQAIEEFEGVAREL